MTKRLAIFRKRLPRFKNLRRAAVQTDKLLRTEVRDGTSRWGAHVPADEVGVVVDPDDLRNFTMEERKIRTTSP